MDELAALWVELSHRPRAPRQRVLLLLGLLRSQTTMKDIIAGLVFDAVTFCTERIRSPLVDDDDVAEVDQVVGLLSYYAQDAASTSELGIAVWSRLGIGRVISAVLDRCLSRANALNGAHNRQLVPVFQLLSKVTSLVNTFFRDVTIDSLCYFVALRRIPVSAAQQFFSAKLLMSSCENSSVVPLAFRQVETFGKLFLENNRFVSLCGEVRRLAACFVQRDGSGPVPRPLAVTVASQSSRTLAMLCGLEPSTHEVYSPRTILSPLIPPPCGMFTVAEGSALAKGDLWALAPLLARRCGDCGSRTDALVQEFHDFWHAVTQSFSSTTIDVGTEPVGADDSTNVDVRDTGHEGWPSLLSRNAFNTVCPFATDIADFWYDALRLRRFLSVVARLDGFGDVSDLVLDQPRTPSRIPTALKSFFRSNTVLPPFDAKTAQMLSSAMLVAPITSAAAPLVDQPPFSLLRCATFALFVDSVAIRDPAATLTLLGHDALAVMLRQGDAVPMVPGPSHKLCRALLFQSLGALGRDRDFATSISSMVPSIMKLFRKSHVATSVDDDDLRAFCQVILVGFQRNAAIWAPLFLQFEGVSIMLHATHRALLQCTAGDATADFTAYGSVAIFLDTLQSLLLEPTVQEAFLSNARILVRLLAFDAIRDLVGDIVLRKRRSVVV